VLLLPLLASPALAQDDRPPGREPDFRMPALADRPAAEGFAAAAIVGDRIRFGVGRFGVAERPRPRSHIEPVPSPTDLRRRHRGSAAIGFSFSF
jgi:hypothetical protein